ncbi:MAG: hypothetical protein U0166_11605 [Acidobacteriota bacterium]
MPRATAPSKAAIAFVCVVLAGRAARANGGAWQEGVPGTGSASSSDTGHKTDVAIEDEALTIDLHAEHAAVLVRYRMHNTGAAVKQDFFFPVERWGPNPDDETTPADLDAYHAAADGGDLTWEDVRAGIDPKAGSVSGPNWDADVTVIRWWKHSIIPFEAGQTREIVVHYESRYSESNESVSDDIHVSDAVFSYSLSPAATWKGPILKGQIDVNILHDDWEDVSIAKPKDRFQKIDDRHHRWTFENLEPTAADDMRIVAHSKYDEYPVSYTDEKRLNDQYVLRGRQYFLDHCDYTAKASSTLPPQGTHHYDVGNIRGDPRRETPAPWAEGAEGDGVGESISLHVTRPLPLHAILILPGYAGDREESWWNNNRVAALEVTLNGEHTFQADIPDERFVRPYVIRVRGYGKPVTSIQLVIKGVHRGKKFQDTCISLVKLRAALERKPAVTPAR